MTRIFLQLWLRPWLTNHDIKSNWFLSTFEIDLIDNVETKFAVDDRIDVVGTLEVTRTTFNIALCT